VRGRISGFRPPSATSAIPCRAPASRSWSWPDSVTVQRKPEEPDAVRGRSSQTGGRMGGQRRMPAPAD